MKVTVDPHNLVVWFGISSLARSAVILRSKAEGARIRRSLGEWPKTKRAWLVQRFRDAIKDEKRWAGKGGAA